MNDLSKERFDARLLEWARSAFVEELQTNFRRASAFDSPEAQRQLVVLRRQPPEHMPVLARVLPLGVWYDVPNAEQLRSRLTHQELLAVEQLRSEYFHQENHEYMLERVEALRRADSPEVKSQFGAAVRIGNAKVREIASQFGYELATAGPGEWGLICARNWGRFTISLNLKRGMTVGYTLGMSDPRLHRIRFHDNYLLVLGIGYGEWVVESPDYFVGKLLRAVEFANWHLQEYDKLVAQVLADADDAPA